MTVAPIITPNLDIEDFFARVADLPVDAQFDAFHAYVAAAFERAGPSTARATVANMIDHMRDQAAGVTDGGVAISAAGVHLLLGYLRYLHGDDRQGGVA